MATIKVRQNGPYLVEGDDVTLRRHALQDRLPGGGGGSAG